MRLERRKPRGAGLAVGRREVQRDRRDPELLNAIDMNGAVVTMDAMGCQEEIAAPCQSTLETSHLSALENQPVIGDSKPASRLSVGDCLKLSGMRDADKDLRSRGGLRSRRFSFPSGRRPRERNRRIGGF